MKDVGRKTKDLGHRTEDVGPWTKDLGPRTDQDFGARTMVLGSRRRTQFIGPRM